MPIINDLPRVTTIIDILREPHLERWRGSIGNEEADRIMKESAWLGTLIHDTITAHELDAIPFHIPSLDPTIQHAISSYQEWRDIAKPVWVGLEQEFTSTKYGFRGTPDRFGPINGEDKITLVDFKTGANRVKYKFQTAGYRILLRENKVPIDRRIILLLPLTLEHNKKAVAVEHSNTDADERGFLHLLDLYHQL